MKSKYYKKMTKRLNLCNNKFNLFTFQKNNCTITNTAKLFV